jgi:hypothetical protein
MNTHGWGAGQICRKRQQLSGPFYYSSPAPLTLPRGIPSNIAIASLRTFILSTSLEINNKYDNIGLLSKLSPVCVGLGCLGKFLLTTYRYDFYHFEPALGGGLWPVLLIHKEGLCSSSGDINRPMMMMVWFFLSYLPGDAMRRLEDYVHG